MTAKAKTEESPRDKIAALSDTKLRALAFRAWRAGQDSKSAKQRARAVRLTPLFRAELKLRNL